MMGGTASQDGNGNVERSLSLGRNRESGVIVLAGTVRVFQKMLSNSRVNDDNSRGAVCFAGMGKIRAA